jgi:CRISPR-associated protein Cas1
LDPKTSVGIARSICIAAARNKISLLMFLQKSRDVNMDVFVGQIKATIENMQVDDVSVLMGYEGRASNVYFGALKDLIPEDFQFKGRIKHPSPDPVNVMLSYGYGILYSKIRFALMKANLNPYHGVLHAAYKKQEALVYDLIEEFRQPVVDKTVLAMLGKRQVALDNFSMDGNMCTMNDEFKRDFSERILDRLASKTKYSGTDTEFSDIIFRQAVELRNSIVDAIPYNAYEYQWR